MADDFNPYQQWLGLPATAAPPNHYELLGLKPFDVEPEQVRRAAVQCKSRVRSHRPGDQAAAWSRLLDELNAAQRCLCEPAEKAAYDSRLRENRESAEGQTASSEEPPGEVFVAPVRNLMPPTWPAAAAAAASAPDAPSASATTESAVPTSPTSAPVAAPSSTTGSAAAPFAIPLGAVSVVPAAAPVAGIQNLAAPIAPNPSHEFVVPHSVPVGAAAQLLPPPAIAVTPTPPVGEATPVEPFFATPPPSSQPPSSPPAATLTEPALAGVARFRTASQVAQPKSPWTPAAMASVCGIGLAILLLAGAIAWVWQTKAAETAALSLPHDPPAADPKPPAPTPPAQEPEAPAPRPKPEPTPEPTTPRPDPPIAKPDRPVEPVPMPKPVPKPEPAPKPIPMPVPEPEPPAPTPEQVRQVQAALRNVRQLLANRDMPGAKAALEEARKLAGESSLKETVIPTETLVHYVSEFWSAVSKAMVKLAGSEVQVGDTRVFVIETGPDRILIRWAGRNRDFTKKTLPAGLARKIAENWLEKSATSKVIVGAFLVVDPTMLENGGKEKARVLWNEAGASGADVADLLKALNES